MTGTNLRTLRSFRAGLAPLFGRNLNVARTVCIALLALGAMGQANAQSANSQGAETREERAQRELRERLENEAIQQANQGNGNGNGHHATQSEVSP